MVPLETLKDGRYTDFKKIGGGGIGTVYKATDNEVFKRDVAIKVLKEKGNEEVHSRFLAEARVFAQLNNPHIVKIHDFGEEDGMLFFVLEFVDGRNLLELIQSSPEGQCDVTTVLSVGIDVCKALRYAHSQNVLHRDIKPENIMITKDGVAQLTDFGLAEIVGQTGVKEKGVIKGTEAYIAPEATSSKADKRSDLYSLGAVLYEAVTGRPPFGKPARNNEEERIRVIQSHIQKVPVSPSELNSKVPQTLAECIMKLLEKEPERRFRSAGDLLEKLCEINAEESSRKTPEPVLESSIVVSNSHLISSKEVRLVDRVEELNLLKVAVERTARGEGGLLFLHGEAGVGKTKLAREAGAYAHSRGMLALYADCRDTCPYVTRTHDVPPYIPPYTLWQQIIKDYLELRPQRELSWIRQFCSPAIFELVPELGRKLGVIPQSHVTKPEKGQDEVFGAVSQLVTEISRVTPLLVVLDDLQWADNSSLQLMRHMARHIQKEPLLLLGDYRDTDVDAENPLFPVLSALNRERLLRSIKLKRLTREDMSDLIRQILQQNEIPSGFLNLVYEKTKGNPFYVEEVINDLKVEEAILREGDKWKIGEIPRIKLPESVVALMRTRIDRLDKECLNVLSLASFLGSNFDCEALRKVTGLGEGRLDRIFGKILKAGLVKEKETSRGAVYVFADDLIIDVMHEEVMHFHPLTHRKLHGKVGRVLERLYASSIDEHSSELARHFKESGNNEKAIFYFMKAGEKAAKLYVNDEAISYFRFALELLGDNQGKISEKERILERLGDIKKICGEPKACMEYWNEALLLGDKLHEKKKVACLHRKMANILWDSIGDVEGAKEHHKICLKIWRALPEKGELARLYEDMAHMYWRNGKPGKARTLAEKALLLAQELKLPEVEADSYVDLTAVYGLTGNARKAREYADRAFRTAQSIQALGGSYQETAARTYLEVAQWLPFEDYEKRLECFKNGLKLAEDMGDISKISKFRSSLAGEYVVSGKLNEARSSGKIALVLDEKAGNKAYIPGDLQIIGFAEQISGDLEKTKKLYDKALKESQDLKDNHSIVSSHFHLGMLYFDRKEYVKARRSLRKALRRCEKAGESQPQITQFLILTLIELGEIKEATGLLRDLQDFADKTEDRSLSAHAGALEAMLLRAQKKWNEAIALFAENRKEWEALKEPIWNKYYFARILLREYSRAYSERARELNREEDKEKANELLTQAQEIFKEIGADGDLREVLKTKERRTA